ncbi:E3 ubiquitin-protein ligase CCNB1IP1-like [Diaphorina citri]|uniref:E3 ubiquitin-protein ligase CCNB1IP1-like n=1 Tax=Diaphorina citri TaxID=121845 RepID=A0A1S4EGP8_DIACI|nr:E3 ubiquitin-protein ligase CCNB1IP1-like [Diaphorina citri]XP_026682573.1 E3 ubiquitin-protein ligase CCNB1IP1-like [Diaphorina citri]XP_026682574.1 E3 ubiquitin-protein ligase CCNB1IP1-like [Diaphorina citri]XP_026682575.1 E3 ubiquitin-protein ligase CCNB1IP1-like [Diaphorina citri]KAI5702045.1 hypothetical protein M8J75_016029 [Diaphorina citri]KAI5729589.1 hypothetical protein M8J76_004318 [Diaphorina citri]KAI5735530.1 hypothetical protein M8J77_019612 [Diaphorina citri]
MCDITLYCNVKKCRKILNATDDGIIWITRCSHAFCNDDGIHLSTTAAKYVPCPACKTQLDLKHDIVRKETNPSEMWKSTILAGLKPEMIIDIVNRSFSFWYYQMSNENLYQTNLNKHLKYKMLEMKTQYQSEMNKLNSELLLTKQKTQAANQDLENQIRKTQELESLLWEKNRCLQNAQMTVADLQRRQSRML